MYSDPFVTVRFNDVIVGKTRHIDDSLEPDWGLDEKFMLEVPAGLNLVDCRLELEMYDYDFMSAADFMGSLIFEGQQLMELFQRIHLENNEIHADNNNQNSIPFTYNSISSITPELIQDHKQSFPLQASNRRTKRENSVVKGELTIFGHAIGSSSIQRQSSESVKNIIKKSNVNLLREKIYSISSDTFRLHVIAAKNLANADTFGKRYDSHVVLA